MDANPWTAKMLLVKDKKDRKQDRHNHPALTLRLPPNVREVLQAIADLEDRTKTKVVIRALRKYAEEVGVPWRSATD